jgi:hypothetical protein
MECAGRRSTLRRTRRTVKRRAEKRQICRTILQLGSYATRELSRRESMERVHISPALGKRKIGAVSTEDVERLASRMLARGASPKTVRNVMTFLHFGVLVGGPQGLGAE